jgi:hypothetical protein
MRKEYDFSNARPNKYAKKYAEGTNIVMIEADLVEFFSRFGERKFRPSRIGFGFSEN